MLIDRMGLSGAGQCPGWISRVFEGAAPITPRRARRPTAQNLVTAAMVRAIAAEARRTRLPRFEGQLLLI